MDELTRDRSAMSLEAANREVYLLLKEGIKVSVPDTDSTPGKGHTSSGLRPPSPQRGEGNGGQKTERVRVIDWEHPANNDFLLVSQFSVTGALGMRTRGYVNHLLYRRRNSRLTPGAPSGLVSPQTMKTYLLTLLYVTVAFSACAQTNETGFVPIFDGQSLTGWHVSAKTGHSAASKNASGGKWVVEDGAIVGSQDIPANGGLVITDQKYSDFEVKLEMKNDFGPDSGLFLRSTEDGRAWQAMIDYHAGGNLMGIYGEGLGGKPHVRNYSFTDKVTEIDPKKTGAPPTPLPVLPSAWPSFWRHGQWNELRARIVNNPPHITTWINGVKIMEWQETEVRHPNEGGIALQVHGGGDYTKQFVRYRKIQVKELKGGEKEQ